MLTNREEPPAMEKEKRANTAVSGGSGELLERLPESMLLEILGRLDLESLCSTAPVCRTLNTLVSQTLSSMTTVDLSGFSPDVGILDRVLRENNVIKSLVVDCHNLQESSVKYFTKHHLQELVLLKCWFFSDIFLMPALQEGCPDLRILKLEIIHDPYHSISKAWVENIEAALHEMFSHLEILQIKIANLDDVMYDFMIIEALPKTLKALQFQPLSERCVKEIISNAVSNQSSIPKDLASIGFQLQSLSLVVSNITDALVRVIVHNLSLLSELCLEGLRYEDHLADDDDLTNVGLQLLGSLKHLTSLSINGGEFSCPFTRVNDIGMFLLAENCKILQSIRLGGFSRVTDAGYMSIMHSCKRLRKIEIVNATSLSNLAFYDVSSLPASLEDLKLISCGLLTSTTAVNLSFCENLKVLDLSGCQSIGNEGLVFFSKLQKLSTLNLKGLGIGRKGLDALGNGKLSISSLSIRGCKRVEDRAVLSLLMGDGTISRTLSSLDLGCVTGITDTAIFTIAEVCKQLRDLCLRCCTGITDASIVALRSMDGFDGKKRVLRRLDLSSCTGLSHKCYQLLTGSSFHGLLWLGVHKTIFANKFSREIAEKRPWVTICNCGCEIGCKNGWRLHNKFWESAWH